MKKEIVIPVSIYNQMVEYGRSCLPFEACGLLSGKNYVVQSIWRLKNEWKSAKRFFVKKEIVKQTVQKIQAQEEQVLAVYHSHPVTAPVPSNFDIMNHPDNNIKMVIISYKTRPPVTKWYHIHGSTYDECLFSINYSQ